MVNFDPRIDYSKEASKTFDEYRNMKKEEQQKEKERLSEPICYARLKFDSLTEDMEGRVKEFHKENKNELWSEGIVTRGYSDSYLGWRSQGFFLPKSLIDFLALNPKQKFKVMGLYKGFAVVEIYSKAYIVPEEILELMEQTGSVAIANEIMVKTDNQLAVKDKIEEARQMIEKVSNFEDEAFAGYLAEIDNLKAEMEAKITAMYEVKAKMMAEMQEKIKRYEHELLVMRSDLTAFEYYNGLKAEFMSIHKGVNAPISQPIVIHQKLIYLDEDLPRLTNLYDVDSGSLEVALKNSPALLEHICPTNKGVSKSKSERFSNR